MWNVRYVWMHSLRHFQGHQGKSTRLYINIIRCWSGQLNSQLLFNPQPAPWQINALMHPEQDQTWSVQTRSDLRSWPGWVRGPRAKVTLWIDSASEHTRVWILVPNTMVLGMGNHLRPVSETSELVVLKRFHSLKSSLKSSLTSYSPTTQFLAIRSTWGFPNDSPCL